jgi:hypothetical protein
MTAPTKDLAIIACGALSVDLTRALAALGVDCDLHPLPPVLHNRPERIAAAVEEQILRLRPHYRQLAIGYADCGTYGALDELCERYDLARLPGQHCYDLLAGPTRIEALLAEEPGTYLLTDFLVAAFDRLVWKELGLDRHPQLRDDYFGNYRRVIWLATNRTPELEQAANRAAERLGLPLETVDIASEASLTANTLHTLARNTTST